MTPPGYPIPPRRYAEPGRAELGPVSGVPSAVRNLGRVEEEEEGTAHDRGRVVAAPSGRPSVSHDGAGMTSWRECRGGVDDRSGGATGVGVLGVRRRVDPDWGAASRTTGRFRPLRGKRASRLARETR